MANGPCKRVPTDCRWLREGPPFQRSLMLSLWLDADDEGNVRASLAKLAESLAYQQGFVTTGPSRELVHDALGRLEEGGAIATQRDARGTLVHIVDYARYQDDECHTVQPGQVPYDAIAAEWNALAAHSPLKAVRSITPKRKAHLRARWQEREFRENYARAFELVHQSAWCTGRHPQAGGWRASFDWIIQNGENYVKALEGTYADRPPASPASGQQAEGVGPRFGAATAAPGRRFGAGSRKATAYAEGEENGR